MCTEAHGERRTYRVASEFRVRMRAREERWQVLNSDKRGGD
ncbi:MAG: hypothetical protein ACFNUE_00555 [Bacteroides sp.]